MADEKSVMAVIRASRPDFKNNHDKLAFAVHASFLASGYVLVATGLPATANDALSSSSTDEVGIDGWNELDDQYAFVYVNPEKNSQKVLVKCLVMSDKLLVDAIVINNGEANPTHLEIDIGNHVVENGGANYSAQYKDLSELVSILDKAILSKFNGQAESSSLSGPSSVETGSGSRLDEIRPGPRFDSTDPQHHPLRVPLPPFGDSDRFPFGGAGIYPSRGPFSEGGMLLGPNDPRWLGGNPAFPGGQPPGVPPGARFDPIGPPGVPGFEPNRFTRNPPRRGGGGIHPDLEHFGSGDFI